MSDTGGARRILITGGLGFLGSNFAQRALAAGSKVRVLDCRLQGSGANPANLDGITDRIEYLDGDVRDPSVVARSVEDVDLVIHAAAQTSHTRSMDDALLSLDVNCRGTLQLLEALRRSDSNQKLVHLGTTTQVGPMVRQPIDELHPEFPRDMYSATMVGSEKYVLIYARTYGLRNTVVRLPNTYGPRAAIHSADLGFVNYFIGIGLQGGAITVYGDGSQRRNLLYVDDAIDVIDRAASARSTDGEVYLAGSDRAYTVAEIAQAIARHIGGTVKFVPWPAWRAAIEVGDAVFDTSKARRTLGWYPRVDLPQGLERTREFFDSRLQHYLGVEA